jgi:hypothetical protein
MLTSRMGTFITRPTVVQPGKAWEQPATLCAACCSVGDHSSATIITGTVLTADNTGLSTNIHTVHFSVDSNERRLCGGAIMLHFTGGEWRGTQTYQGWHPQTNPDPNIPQRTMNGIYVFNGNEVYAVGDGGFILHMLNGGQTWNVEARFARIKRDLPSCPKWYNTTYGQNDCSKR